MSGPLKLAALCTVLDGVWAAQALGAAPRHEASTVSMVSMIVWVVFHLPAAALAGGVLKAAGTLKDPAAALPAWSFFLTGILGLLQTFGLVFGLASWQRRAR